MIPLLSPKPFAEYEPLEYLEYIKSLRVIPVSKTLSKSVEGMHISTGRKLITRVPKGKETFSNEEIDSLVKEFKVDKEKLIKNLQAKKIQVLDANGNTIPKAKRNVNSKLPSGRKKAPKDELLITKPDSGVQA